MLSFDFESRIIVFLKKILQIQTNMPILASYIIEMIEKNRFALDDVKNFVDHPPAME